MDSPYSYAAGCFKLDGVLEALVETAFKTKINVKNLEYKIKIRASV